MIKKALPVVLLLLSLMSTTIYAEDTEEKTDPIRFIDVEEGDEHYVAINYLQSIGIIDGYEDNTFKPYKKVNRAEALKMLTLASGLFKETPEISDGETENSENINDSKDSQDTDEEKTDSAPFTDTPEDAWYTPFLIAAKEKGIISGYDDGSFKPEQTVNLAESLKIYLTSFDNLNYEPIEANLFSDTPELEWFTPYTAYAGAHNLLEVNLDNEIFPNQEMTRGHLAEIIYRKIRSQDGYDFGKATFYGSAVQGSGTASGETFDKDSYTAAHRSLPFGSLVEVRNLDNGKTVEVKITDRGPYGPGRVLDLSSAAFNQIASLGTGVIDVEYKALFIPEN